MGDEKSKKRMKDMVHGEVTKMFEAVLDYVQVACPAPDAFKVLRAKILRVGNDCSRTIRKEIDNYDVEYTLLSEEIIEVNQNRK